MELESRELAAQTIPELRYSYFVQNVIDYVPNPWQAKDVINRALAVLKERFSEEEIARHQIFLLSEIEKILKGDEARIGELDRLARAVFDRKLHKDTIRLVLKFGKEVLKPETYYERENLMNVKESLFEPVPAKSFNELETEIAYKLDERTDRTYWWVPQLGHAK